MIEYNLKWRKINDKYKLYIIGQSTLAFSGVGRILVREEGGGNSWPPKGYHAPPAGGGLRPPPRMVAKFKILKRFKVLENESIFQK